MFNNILKTKKNKEDELKELYEYQKQEIDRKIKSLKQSCENNIDKKRNFMFEKTGFWDLFSFSKEEIDSAFEETVKEYEKSMIKEYVVARFGEYEWCEESKIFV